MKGRRKSKGLVLVSDRDRKLFNYLFENKVATQQQINRDIFQNSTNQAVNQRLLKLRREKYISVRAMLINSSMRYIYEVTRKGVEELKEDYPFEMHQYVLKSDSPKHDLALVDICFHLRKFVSVKNIITENALQCYQNYRQNEELSYYTVLKSDGCIEMDYEGERALVALEFDRTRKGKARYGKKIRTYYQYDQINAVFFICENKSIANAVLKIDKKVCTQKVPKFFVCQRKDVETSSDKLTFENFKGHSIVLK